MKALRFDWILQETPDSPLATSVCATGYEIFSGRVPISGQKDGSLWARGGNTILPNFGIQTNPTAQVDGKDRQPNDHLSGEQEVLWLCAISDA